MAHDDEPHGPQVGRDGETPVQPPVHLPETDDDLFGPMEPVFVEPPVPEPDPQEWPPQSGGEYADPTGQTIAPAAPAQDDAGPGEMVPENAAPDDGDAPDDAAADATEDSPAKTAEDATPDAPEAVAPGEAHAGPLAVVPVEARRSWRRVRRLIRPRISSGNLLAALMTLVVGFALVAQVRATQDVGLEELRETDLVALLDDVTARADSLEAEIRQLEEDRRVLTQGSGPEAAAAAQARLESLQILSGSVAVQGPGITMTVSAPEGDFTQTMMIDVMQELRDAGAEAIQIGPNRVVAHTWIGTEGGVVTVDGTEVPAPFRIVAIGDSHTLATAMAIPGGFSDSVRGIGGEVRVVEGDSLVIDALHQPSEPAYARPVPSE